MNVLIGDAPELAALLGDAVFEIKHGPLGSDGAPVWHRIESLTQASVEHFTPGTRLYCQPGLPTVQGIDELMPGEKPMAYAVVIGHEGHFDLYLEATEKAAQLRCGQAQGDDVSRIVPVKVHGLTLRAFFEAQHYRASAGAFAQNAMDLQARCKRHESREQALEQKLAKVTQAVLALSEQGHGAHLDLWAEVHQALVLKVEAQQG